MSSLFQTVKHAVTARQGVAVVLQVFFPLLTGFVDSGKSPAKHRSLSGNRGVLHGGHQTPPSVGQAISVMRKHITLRYNVTF